MTAPPERGHLTFRTRAGIVVSLLVFAAFLVGAWALPGLLAPAPRPDPAASALPEAAVTPGQRAQAALVAAEDGRLLGLLRGIPFRAPAYTERGGPVATTVLTARQQPYTLDDLERLGAARPGGPRVVDLVSSVLVGPGARLEIEAPGTTLRMVSGPDGFTSLVGWGGSVSLSGSPGARLRIEAHDPVDDVPDTRPDDGRAYVRVVGADLDTGFVDVVGLGFWSGRTGGLAVTGGAGVATGTVADTFVTGCVYGLYSSDTDNLTVRDSRMQGNAADGVLLHHGSVASVLRRVLTDGNGGVGIAATRGASAVLLDGVAAAGNAGPGIELDGRPLAERPGPGGEALTGSAGYVVLGAVLHNNRGVGLVARDADDLLVSGADVADNAEGIVVTGPTRGARIEANRVRGSAGTGIAVRDGPTDTSVAGNAVAGGTNGVQVRAAGAGITRTTVSDARLHALSFQGTSPRSWAGQNVLAGHGTSAIDTTRLDARTPLTLAGNDVGGWQVEADRVRALGDLVEDRPLVLLWSLVLVVPVLVTVARLVQQRRQRSRHRRGRHPYPQAARLHALPALPEPGSEPITTPAGTRLTTRSSS